MQTETKYIETHKDQTFVMGRPSKNIRKPQQSSPEGNYFWKINSEIDKYWIFFYCCWCNCPVACVYFILLTPTYVPYGQHLRYALPVNLFRCAMHSSLAVSYCMHYTSECMRVSKWIDLLHASHSISPWNLLIILDLFGFKWIAWITRIQCKLRRTTISSERRRSSEAKAGGGVD